MTTGFTDVNIDSRHQYGISFAEAQTFLPAKLSSVEEEGDTAVFAGYISSSFLFSLLMAEPLETRHTWFFLGNSHKLYHHTDAIFRKSFIDSLLIQGIGHLPDSTNLIFKMRPNMKMSLTFMRIRSHSEIKGFAVTLVLKQRLVIIR